MTGRRRRLIPVTWKMLGRCHGGQRIWLGRRTGWEEALYQADAAVREALFGNLSIAKQRAVDALELSKSRDVAYFAGFALALAGESSRSQALTEDLSRRLPEDTSVQFTYVPTLRALLALNHSQPSKTVELLQTAIPYEGGSPSTGGSEFLLGAGNLYSAYVRGLAYLAAHHGAEAAGEFQKILDHSWKRSLRSGSVLWHTCSSAGLTHCREMTPKQDRPIRTSLCSGKMPTPRSLSSSRLKPSMQSCNSCVAPLWKLGVRRTPNETVQKSDSRKCGATECCLKLRCSRRRLVQVWSTNSLRSDWFRTI